MGIFLDKIRFVGEHTSMAVDHMQIIFIGTQQQFVNIFTLFPVSVNATANGNMHLLYDYSKESANMIYINNN